MHMKLTMIKSCLFPVIINLQLAVVEPVGGDLVSKVKDDGLVDMLLNIQHFKIEPNNK